MPIDATLLARLKKNDPTWIELNLSGRHLTSVDMWNLIKALKTNTTLTLLNVYDNKIGVKGAKVLATSTTLTRLHLGRNQIGDEGAKALASNTTLTTLKVRGNHNIGVYGAKALASNTTLTTLDMGLNQIGNEGAKALASNPTLTTLNLAHNKIGTEGAKALATNITLTTLDVSFNQIEAEGLEALASNITLTELDADCNLSGTAGSNALNKLNAAIANNKQQLNLRRSQFLRTLLVLANEQANPISQSYWAKLPREIRLYIISLIKFTSIESIGKSTRQIYACAKFMFTHTAELKTALQAAIKTQQNFKVIENSVMGHFQFFPSKPALSADTSVSNNLTKKLKPNPKN